MPYILLAIGLLLILFAAFLLGARQPKAPFDAALREEVDRPLNRELVALYQLQEMVESALRELDEKNQVFQQLMLNYGKQREAVEYRLQQFDHLQQKVQSAMSSRPENKDTVAGRQRHLEVYRLFDQGAAIHEIATELGMGRGEVQLILGLRKSGS